MIIMIIIIIIIYYYYYVDSKYKHKPNSKNINKIQIQIQIITSPPGAQWPAKNLIPSSAVGPCTSIPKRFTRSPASKITEVEAKTSLLIDKFI